MFNRKKIERLKNQIKALTEENQALDNSNKSLKNQRDTLVKENNGLSVKIADITDEANKAMEAKEAERQELCDQLGQLQHQVDKEIIRRIIKENAWLVKTNANLSDHIGLKPNARQRYQKNKNQD